MIKEKLEAIKNGNSNLYEHIIKVLRQMILSNDKDSYQLFQYYSQKVKSDDAPSSQFRNQQFKQLLDYVNKTTNILNKPPSGEEGQQPGPTGYVPNLMEEAKWFEKCGIGFGEQLTYLIFKSLQRFSIVKQVKELKFWGKITALNNDYYIAESPADPSEEELPPDVEPKGQGINKTTYWVSTNLNGDWVQLPTITPSQMRISRQIKYIFTGNLERDIFTNPHFTGKEKHLLKCQIVRIVHSCTLVPRTKYIVKVEDDKKEVEAAEQWKMPSFNFLASADNWVHFTQNILNNGRLSHLPPEIPEGVEVDEEKLKKQIEAKDPFEEPLKPISKDNSKENQVGWVARAFGDCCEYKAMAKNKEQVNYGFVCLKSLIWKGWFTVYHQQQWINIYIGNGIKASEDWYYPKSPENIFGECNDKCEQPQPNFPPQQVKKEEEEGEKQADD